MHDPCGGLLCDSKIAYCNFKSFVTYIFLILTSKAAEYESSDVRPSSPSFTSDGENVSAQYLLVLSSLKYKVR
jgi:hypothetical protein